MTQLDVLEKEIKTLKEEIKVKKEAFKEACKEDLQGTLTEVFTGRKRTEYGINEIKFIGLYTDRITTLSFLIYFEDNSTEGVCVENPIFSV